MIHDSELLQVAAGIDFDTIAPFVFVILIVASQIMGALKKKSKQGEEEPDVDAVERARQIREEIRRKIEERRQEMEPGTTRPVLQPQRPAYDPTRPDGQQQRAPQIQRQPVQQQRPVVQQALPTRPVARPVQQAPVSRQPSLEEQLAEQRKRLEVARRHQKEAKAKARRMLQESASERSVRENQSWEIGVNPNKIKNQLINGLRNNNEIRKAVLYREILDKPLGLR